MGVELDWKELVGEDLRVYDVRTTKQAGQTIYSLCIMRREGGPELHTAIETIRLRARAKELYILVHREAGEDILTIAARPPPMTSRTKLHAGLLLATLVTTSMGGAMLWNSYSHPNSSFSWTLYLDPMNWLFGALWFGLPLLLILGIHELGHMFMARKYGLRATLPFFIPVPPFLMPIGTFGAFIRMQDPFPHRKALFDIGVAGPIAGFIVALPVVFLGVILTAQGAVIAPIQGQPDLILDGVEISSTSSGIIKFNVLSEPAQIQITSTAKWEGIFTSDGYRSELKLAEGEKSTIQIASGVDSFTLKWDDGLLQFGEPLLLKLSNALQTDENYLSHPLFIAGWVGLLVTSINLLPVGQLDGGHVSRALLGKYSRILAFAAMLAIVYLSVNFGAYLLLALFIFWTGIDHPPTLDDRSPLPRSRIVVGILALLIFAVTFVAIPVY